jgi:hypothetical protein
MDPVPDPTGSARNLTRTSGFVARNSDRQTTEAVNYEIHKLQNPTLDNVRKRVYKLKE